MKKVMIAAIAAFAAFAANTETNAQVNNQTERQIQSLVKKGEAYLLSQGKPEKVSTPTSLASQKTYIFDSEILELKAPVEYQGKMDTLMVNWRLAIKRNPTSGIAVGPAIGFVQMAENSSPVGGAQLTMAWKKVELSGGLLVGISKYNNESNMAGKSFVCPIAFGEIGYIAHRFSMRGYNNQGYISFGVGAQYVFDKNNNNIGENTYETPTEVITEKNEFMVEGNSTSIYGYAKVRFSLGHMSGSAISIKAFGGVYNRYYLDGSRRKAIVGATIAWEFSGAKKNVDSDVKSLKTHLENGDYEFANEVINQMRANIK